MPLNCVGIDGQRLCQVPDAWKELSGDNHSFRHRKLDLPDQLLVDGYTVTGFDVQLHSVLLCWCTGVIVHWRAEIVKQIFSSPGIVKE